MIRLTNTELKAIYDIVNYCWYDEQEDYAVTDNPKEHIYLSLRRLRRLRNVYAERINVAIIPTKE